MLDVWQAQFKASKDELLLVLSEPTFWKLVDNFDSQRAEVVMDGNVKLLTELQRVPLRREPFLLNMSCLLAEEDIRVTRNPDEHLLALTLPLEVLDVT